MSEPAALTAATSAAGRGRELGVLVDVARVLSSGLDLRAACGQVLKQLNDGWGMRRGMLVLLDGASGRLRIEAAEGLTPDEMRKAQYDLGEGVTGRVVARGEARCVADVRREPDFLNRTGRLTPQTAGARAGAAVSFICVPVRADGRVAGALSVDTDYVSDEQLRTDQALLEVVAGLVAQAIRIDRMVLRGKAELLTDGAQHPGPARQRQRFAGIVGDSPAMHEVFATVGQVAASRATVLLLGETGTGKEMIAKAIHHNSPRKERAFVRVNCGALSGTLLESELFGHVRGSFTGAIRDKLGRFEVADGGTIFLDEIGTLEPHLQVKLLRVLQEREFERVGDTHTVKVDVRVIAATNVDLQERVAKGSFREDLLYRLNVVSVYLPPLRNRREDIPALVDHFLGKYNAINARDLSRISRDLLNVLVRYPWPGNVRELENAIEHAVVLSRDEDFTEDLLPLSVRMFAQQRRNVTVSESIEALSRRLAKQAIAEYSMREGEIHALVIEQVERALLEAALARCEGVKIRAADFLGINRNTLNKKVKDMGIEPD